MSKEIIISPSILGADFHNLNNELKRVESADLKYLHFDVMDGVFVNNISIGIPVVKALRPHFDVVFDFAACEIWLRTNGNNTFARYDAGITLTPKEDYWVVN